MEINFNKPEETKFFFKNLEYGDTFTDETFEGAVLMRIKRDDCDYSIEFDEPYYGAAINLKNGIVYGYGSDEPVIPVSCSLTANFE